MNNLGVAIAFGLGAAIGSIVTWRVLKTKYEQIAQEEIDSVKEAFANRKENYEQNTDVSQVREATEEKDALVAEINKLNYATFSNDKKEEEEKDVDAPYIISSDAYGEYEGFELETLTYYADGVVANDNGEVIEDVERLIGEEWKEFMIEDGEECVFVRNETLETDYEVVADPRKYSEIIDSTYIGG